MKFNYYLYAACLFCSGCMTSPVTGGKRLFGIIPVPFTTPTVPPSYDPYAIWQQWAIFIIIGGIIMGVIDYVMDKKLTLIGPAIALCGLVVSIWGVTLPIVAKILPWALGAGVVAWAVLLYLKQSKKKVV